MLEVVGTVRLRYGQRAVTPLTATGTSATLGYENGRSLKVAEGSDTFGVHDALGNAFAIEVRQLLVASLAAAAPVRARRRRE